MCNTLYISDPYINLYTVKNFKKEMLRLRRLVEEMPLQIKEEIDVARNTVTEMGSSKISDMTGKNNLTCKKLFTNVRNLMN